MWRIRPIIWVYCVETGESSFDPFMLPCHYLPIAKHRILPGKIMGRQAKKVPGTISVSVAKKKFLRRAGQRA